MSTIRVTTGQLHGLINTKARAIEKLWEDQGHDSRKLGAYFTIDHPLDGAVLIRADEYEPLKQKSSVHAVLEALQRATDYSNIQLDISTLYWLQNTINFSVPTTI